MIRIDALYLLLLMELSVLLAGGMVFFLLRARKYRSLYQQSLKDLNEAQHAPSESRRTPQTPARSAKAVPKEDTGERDDLRAKLNSVTEELKTKTDALEQLQVKFADLEKEYLILYHQQQKK